MVTARNKFNTLQEICERHSLNVTAHIEAAAAECIPTKLRAKCRVPWESLVVRKNQNKFLKKYLYSIKETKQMPMHRGLRKFESNEPTHTKKMQLEYIQGQINKIRNSVEDRQS